MKSSLNRSSARNIHRTKHLARARIGLIANQENDNCLTPDSFIGFGTSYGNAINCAGNFGPSSSDNGYLNTKTIGYIMAR